MPGAKHFRAFQRRMLRLQPGSSEHRVPSIARLATEASLTLWCGLTGVQGHGENTCTYSESTEDCSCRLHWRSQFSQSISLKQGPEQLHPARQTKIISLLSQIMWRSGSGIPLFSCSRALPNWCHTSCLKDKFPQTGKLHPWRFLFFDSRLKFNILSFFLATASDSSLTDKRKPEVQQRWSCSL